MRIDLAMWRVLLLVLAACTGCDSTGGDLASAEERRRAIDAFRNTQLARELGIELTATGSDNRHIRIERAGADGPDLALAVLTSAPVRTRLRDLGFVKLIYRVKTSAGTRAETLEDVAAAKASLTTTAATRRLFPLVVAAWPPLPEVTATYVLTTNGPAATELVVTATEDGAVVDDVRWAQSVALLMRAREGFGFERVIVRAKDGSETYLDLNTLLAVQTQQGPPSPPASAPSERRTTARPAAAVAAAPPKKESKDGEPPAEHNGLPLKGCSGVMDMVCCTYSGQSCSYTLCRQGASKKWVQNSWACF